MGVILKQGIKSGVYIFIGFLIGSVSSIFIFPKLCSKAELGQFQYLLQWSIVIAQFVSLGAGAIAVRFYAKYKNQNREKIVYFMSAMFWIAGSFLFVLIALLFPWLFTGSNENEALLSEGFMIWILIAFTISQSAIKIYSGLAIAIGKSPSNFFINEVFIRVAVLACFILYGVGYVGFEQLFYFLTIAYFFQAFFILISTKVYSYFGYEKIEKHEFKQMTYYGGYSILDGGATMLINRLDILMILYLVNSLESVQEYSMVVNLTTVIMLPWRSVVSPATPLVSQFFLEGSLEKINNLYKRASINLLLTGGFIFCCIFCNIDDLIKMIPDDYSVIKFPVLFLGIAKIVDMTSSINSQILVLSPYYKYNLYFNLLLIVIAFVSNVFLVPVLGITGSAVSTLIAIVFFNVFKGFFLYKKYGFNPFTNKTLITVLLVVLVFVTVYFIPLHITNIFAAVILRCSIISVLFIVILFLFKPSSDVIQFWTKYKNKHLRFGKS